MPSTIRHSLILLCASALSMAAQATDAPPIKPGLWQVHTERAVDGVSGDTSEVKICLSPKSLSQAQWLGPKNGARDCQTEVKTRSPNRWTWHSSCGQPPSETDGEVIFNSPQSYATKVATITTVKGESTTLNTSSSATRLGARCGDVKPEK